MKTWLSQETHYLFLLILGLVWFFTLPLVPVSEKKVHECQKNIFYFFCNINADQKRLIIYDYLWFKVHVIIFERNKSSKRSLLTSWVKFVINIIKFIQKVIKLLAH